MGYVENLRKRIRLCIVINLFSLLVFMAGGRGYGEFFVGIPQALGPRAIIALVLAVINVVVGVAFLKERRKVEQWFGIKYPKRGAIFGILAAMATLLTEGIFTPLVAMGWDWIQGNLVGLLFVLPMIIDVVGIVAFILIGAQLGLYLTGMAMLILLYNDL